MEYIITDSRFYLTHPVVSEFYRSSIFKHSSGLKEVNFCDFQFAAENPNDSENSWISSEFSMLVFLCLVLLTNITLFICLLYLFSIFVYSIFVSYSISHTPHGICFIL